MAEREGFAYVPQARNFTIENKFSSEGFLANCHWQFSPYRARMPHLLHQTKNSQKWLYQFGGEGGIRTLETVAGLPVFKTGPFNHSGTSPYLYKNRDGSKLLFMAEHTGLEPSSCLIF